jgi:cyclic 2,3-diphosphoglycerate synthase
VKRAIVVIDGEHYAPVVRDALAALPYDVVAAYFAGGTEKLRGDDDYGVPLVDSLDAVEADLIYDLSDEPVLTPRARLRLASEALALGLPYVGADFRFDPPAFEPFDVPSLAVIGTGKRVGKTAVAAHVARVLARDRRVVIVAMGRGGPAEPELVETSPTLAGLLERSRAGRHAASDHLELATFTGLPVVGCRRAGGGLAGAVADSNVLAGAELARSLDPDVVVFDGSGAAIPPIATTARILVTRDAGELDEYLNPYRVAISDLVVVPTLRLRPAAPLRGRVAVFATGAVDLAEVDADVVHVSRALANRAALRAELAAIDADTFLVELKAAAIDVVAEAALERGVDVVLAENEVCAPEIDVAALLPAEVPA